MAIFIVVLVIVAALVIFSVQNANPVAVSFILWHFEASLAIIVFLSLVAGVISMGIVSLFLKWRRPKRGVPGHETRYPASGGGGPIDPSATA
jgi:uncharacterized integral membrane protein